MYLAKDSGAYSNPWLAFMFEKWLWTNEKKDAYKFHSEAAALQVGQAAMPTRELKERVISVPAE